MKVKFKIISEKLEESVIFLSHKMTPFIQNLIQIIESNPSSQLFVKKVGEDRERKVDYYTILYLEYLERKIFVYAFETEQMEITRGVCPALRVI
ncbi:hypothetical protein M3194_13565 [Paenibacillus glycanilyticus]|uniref:hypothetical protein n=1 Tax=Paenibacillus glycanilyticus TaxID=126569 RepID=UPI002042495F|nr:hypothetical protein [Paenibacillus glycanilyticus]MCM3628392.1 hypothetical protein [Paenibacillus glycanilyticus]